MHAPSQARKYAHASPIIPHLTSLFHFLIISADDYDMANQRKRSAAAMHGAPTATGTATSSAKITKKRKTDGQKFYAVRIGWNPGIYTNYAECQAQMRGYSHAKCMDP